MSERTYTLTITEGQARLISDACDLLAQVHMGQFEEVRYELERGGAIDREVPERMHILGNGLRSLAAVYTQMPVGQSHGISSLKISDRARIAIDVHHVLRHRLAWDDLAPGEKRTFQNQFDEPFHWAKGTPLARVERNLTSGERYARATDAMTEALEAEFGLTCDVASYDHADPWAWLLKVEKDRAEAVLNRVQNEQDYELSWNQCCQAVYAWVRRCTGEAGSDAR